MTKDMKMYKTPPKTLPRSPGHHQEWIDACKGGKPAGMDLVIEQEHRIENRGVVLAPPSCCGEN
jgi:hypothetical protein